METLSERLRNLIFRLRRLAIPLAAVEAGSGFADLQPLKPVIGGARIVALGEATHGTREFFQLKHRLLEFLVTEMGFTTFAIEANWPESLEVNEYVLHGRGDPAMLLAELHCWPWDTEEVLDLIRWMRQYNTSSTHRTRVRFSGFDAQFTAVAAATIKSGQCLSIGQGGTPVGKFQRFTADVPTKGDESTRPIRGVALSLSSDFSWLRRFGHPSQRVVNRQVTHRHGLLPENRHGDWNMRTKFATQLSSARRRPQPRRMAVWGCRARLEVRIPCSPW
jgi:erythromycin esterase-like protein